MTMPVWWAVCSLAQACAPGLPWQHVAAPIMTAGYVAMHQRSYVFQISMQQLHQKVNFRPAGRRVKFPPKMHTA